MHLITTSQLLSCVEQQKPIPATLVKLTYDFTNGETREQLRQRKGACPGSICEISFRLINLLAIISNENNADSTSNVDLNGICSVALDIDNDLEDWKASVSSHWSYDVADRMSDVDTTDPLDDPEERRHLYPSHWVAEAWNNWRALRIATNQVIFKAINDQCHNLSSSSGQRDKSVSAVRLNAIDNIHRFSTEICIAAKDLVETPCR